MEQLLRIYRVARILDCTPKNVYNLVKAGRLESVRLRPRQMRVTASSLNRYIREKMD